VTSGRSTSFPIHLARRLSGSTARWVRACDSDSTLPDPRDRVASHGPRLVDLLLVRRTASDGAAVTWRSPFSNAILVVMAVIVAACISVLGVLLVEAGRWRASTRRCASAAADARFESHDEFIHSAIETVVALDSASALSSRLPFAPAHRSLRDALRLAEQRRSDLLRAHALIRRSATDAVADAADAVLDVVAKAADLTSSRRRGDRRKWDEIWAEMRCTRIAFGRAAGNDRLTAPRHRRIRGATLSARNSAQVVSTA
jgi:hypothetical protein